MITVDTSTWIYFYQQSGSSKLDIFTAALEAKTIVMLPPVLTELLSSTALTVGDKQDLTLLPRLELLNGFWERTGWLRHKLLKQKFKARTLDCQIAQICIDHKVPLLTDDADFRHFKIEGLLLL